MTKRPLAFRVQHGAATTANTVAAATTAVPEVTTTTPQRLPRVKLALAGRLHRCSESAAAIRCLRTVGRMEVGLDRHHLDRRRIGCLSEPGRHGLMARRRRAATNRGRELGRLRGFKRGGERKKKCEWEVGVI